MSDRVLLDEAMGALRGIDRRDIDPFACHGYIRDLWQRIERHLAAPSESAKGEPALTGYAAAEVTAWEEHFAAGGTIPGKEPIR
jgi:hypothetical protein